MEKNTKWIQDRYVKFIRFSSWKIDETDESVLDLITNHCYLDNPMLRGMRQSLMNSFDDIYLLDLHGNNFKKYALDSSKDENVFYMQQGVAICFMIKFKLETDESGFLYCIVVHCSTTKVVGSKMQLSAIFFGSANLPIY